METDVETKVPQMDRKERLNKLPVDGQSLKHLTHAGLVWLRTHQSAVNALNVFPVPDGDTGTNMVLTMQAAYDEIADMEDLNLGKMVQAFAHGALMGARGNSGVILSQLWRGFARTLGDQPRLDGATMVQGFCEARDTAYRGVVRPVEGTILTVAKDMATAAEQALEETDNLIIILERVVEAADLSVQRTPELLPVLAEAGVVDAGGLGLFLILEGMLRYLNRQSLERDAFTVQPLVALDIDNTMETVEPGQDFEVVVDFSPRSPLILENFYRDLEQMGTSIQVGEGDGIYRVHIHVPTENLYAPLDYTRSLGTVTKASIENLIAQMETLSGQDQVLDYELAEVDADHIAVVAVSPGLGITRVFASLGAAAIVDGGQTMNPSTQDILAAFEDLPTDKIIILPNNKNILMAAEAASSLSVKDVAVVPTVNVPQGLAAIMCVMPDGDFEQVLNDMNASMGEVESGEVTTAVRSVEIDGVQVEEGQIIALHNGSLVCATESMEEAIKCLLAEAKTEHRELITLFSGEDVNQDQVETIVQLIQELYPDQEVEVQEGGQPHYQYIISIE